MLERGTAVYLTYFRTDGPRRPSGGEIYNRRVLEPLRKPPFSLVERVQEDAPPMFRPGPLANLWFLAILALTRYDLVVADAGFLGRCWLALAAARLRGKPVALIVHHYNFHLKANPLERAYDRFASWAGLALSRRLLSSSRFTWDETRILFGYSKPWAVIPPTLSFKPHPRGPKGDGARRYRLLYAGSIEPRKHIEALVRLANEADPSLDFTLDVAGHEGQDPEYAREVKASVRRPDRIRFLGYVPADELARLYAEADLFVFPSKWEGFGMAALEAMAQGVPVLAFAVSAIPTVVRAGVDGVLVPPFDMEAWRAEFESLLRRPERLRELAGNCRLPPEYAQGWEAKAREAVAFLAGKATEA